jgi:hypothetical protein
VTQSLATQRLPGGQPHNVNAAKHGGRSRRFGVVLVSLAQGLRAVRNGLIGLRKGWHDQAIQVHGEPLPWQVTGALARALDWERSRQLGQRLAAKTWPDDPGRALDLEQQAARAGEKRDEALQAALAVPGQDNAQDRLRRFYSTPEPDVPTHRPEPADARAGHHGDGAGGPEPEGEPRDWLGDFGVAPDPQQHEEPTP